jgi:hypothetical protein
MPFFFGYTHILVFNYFSHDTWWVPTRYHRKSPPNSMGENNIELLKMKCPHEKKKNCF